VRVVGILTGMSSGNEEAKVVGPASMNWAERELVRRVREGAWAEFAKGAEGLPHLRASFLRRLILGLVLDEECEGLPLPALLAGVRVRGAYIEGSLDLSDCAGLNGSPLPPLLLEGCEIPDSLDVSYARLARFSIAESQITHIRIYGTRLEGTFDFSRVSPCVAPTGSGRHGIAWIEADGAHIAGPVDGKGAHLQAPPPRPTAEIQPTQEHYALRLSTCNVRGRINLTGQFRAIGGVSLYDSAIRGDIRLTDATIVAGESYALMMQRARLGMLFLDRGFTARGAVWLLGAKMTDLQCTDAILENSMPDGSAYSLVITSGEISGI
jgi:hypothetical protein